MLVKIKTWKEMLSTDGITPYGSALHKVDDGTVFTKKMRKYCGKTIDFINSSSLIGYTYSILDSEEDRWHFAKWMFEKPKNRNGANKC